MDNQNLGGNSITSFGNKAHNSDCIFSVEPYLYYSLVVNPGDSKIIKHSNCLIYFQDTEGGELTVNGRYIPISNGDVFFNAQNEITFKSNCKSRLFIVADSSEGEPVAVHIKNSGLKVVTKPWGKEIWINHPTFNFSLKEIHINQNTKTSLQYHHFKTETNLIFKGNAVLSYKSNGNCENNDVTTNDIAHFTLYTGDVIHVTPNNIHRLEAISDLVLLEASTNHLDDVIRIQDDFNRKDGKIESEHAKKY